MKHKVAVLISLIAIIVIGISAAHVHHEYEVQQAKIVAANHAVQVKSQEVQARANATFQYDLELDQEQCASDKTTYQALPLATREKTPAPDCVVNLVK